MRKIACLMITAMILLVAGCSIFDTQRSAPVTYQSYKEIPGVTQDEIDALDALLAKKPRLVYAVAETSESFFLDDGTIGGFTSLFCNRMSELFGFEFEFITVTWDNFAEKFSSYEIDLTGELTATPERSQKYFMTDAIAQRTVKIFTDMNAESLDTIAQTRPIRCAFQSGSITYLRVVPSWDLPFEPVFINDHSDVPNMLLNDEIDAFIEEGTYEAAFDAYDFLKTEEYYPLLYSSVSLATENPEIQPIIDVMQKYLRNGGSYELSELYSQGYKDYLKNKLWGQLTNEEKEYIQTHIESGTPILAACEVDNYPTSFYNAQEKEFQGMALDTLEKISDLTGLNFQVGNEPDAPWAELLDGLKSGKYSICSELLRSPQREDRFIWADQPYCENNYALISKAEYPDININQILFSKVGLMEDSGHTDVFLKWFPDNENTTMYNGIDEAFSALKRGEIDLLMASRNMLLNLTNYQENPGFKANFIFKSSSDSFFGFHKDETALRSIVDKALRYTDTEEISTRWQRKVFDYQSKMLRDMIPYMIAFSAILLAALIVVIAVLMKNRKINKNLDKTVGLRTNELESQATTLERRLQQQRLMAALSQNFINVEDTDEMITKSLQMTGEFLGIGRILLIKYENHALCYHYEWCNPSSRAKRKQGIILPVDDFGAKLTSDFSQRQITHFSLSDEDRAWFIEHYSLEDIDSFLMLPVYVNDEFWGVLEFDQCEVYSPWTPSDINLGEMIAGILSGVLSRRQMENELARRTSELALQTATLSTIYTSIPDLVFCKDTNGIYTSCNPSFEKFAGMTEAELVGKNDAEIFKINEEMVMLFMEADKRVLSNNGTEIIEELLTYPDGTTKFMETYKTPLIQDNKVIGMMGISRDITARKASEETFRLTLDNLDACVYITEIETGEILFINNKMAKEYGDPDCIGKKCWEVLQKGLSERCDFCPVPKLMESGDKECIWEEHSSATGKYYRNTDSIIKWHDGRLVHMQHSVDITNLIELQKDLENASKAKGDFLSRMSHEIRTPLNAIIGMVGIAMNTNDNGRIMDCLKKAENASKLLLGIINDILDMSKIEADKFELSYSEFDFEKVLMSITNVINFRAEERHQNLVVNMGDDIPAFIFSDELRLSQVITNLLSNAVKFTAENGTVVLNARKIDDADGEVTLQIDVTDNGIGISEEQQSRLFTSFEQADGSISRKFGGTGLGLAISKRIVELMGGRIWIESELGKGSKFIFTMKAKKGAEKIHTKIAQKLNKENIRILAVDDSEETRNCFSQIMEAHGLPHDVAAGGTEALYKVEQCGNRPYNVFFIDWQMPEMDGIELTKKIKELDEDSAVVLMISADDWNKIENEAISAGVNQFVSKPLFPSLLIDAVNECHGVEAAKAEVHAQGSQNHLEISGHTILIAEDVEINQEIIAAVLEETGVSIDFADNGQMAVSMFRENPGKYSLILMDIQMPEMDGYEATRAIRALNLEQAKDIPIIAMTANVFKEDIEKCLSAGMNDHLGKPVDANALFMKLHGYLNYDRLEKEANEGGYSL